MSLGRSNEGRPRGFARRLISGIAVIAMSLGMVGLTASAANAAPKDHVELTLWKGNTQLTDGVKVREGETLRLEIEYNHDADPAESLAGQEVIFTFAGLDLDISDFDLTGNDAIESIVISGNTVTVKFVDTWPNGVTTGYVESDLNIVDVDNSGEAGLSWDLNGSDAGTIQIVVIEKDDKEAITADAAGKSAGTPNDGAGTAVDLSAFVKMTTDASGTSFDSLDCVALNGTVVPYTLTLQSAGDRTDYTISDALPAGLDFASVTSVTRTFWDANGLNENSETLVSPAAYTATATTAGFDVTFPQIDGPAIFEIQVNTVFNLDAAECAALETQLKAAYDASRNSNDGAGSFSVGLINTATFPEIGDHTAEIKISGYAPGPNIGSAFGKADDLGEFYVTTDADGKIIQYGSPLVDGPVNINYTLSADLRQWDNTDADFTLQRNGVITDTLPTTASWNTADAGFLTVDSRADNTFAGLAEAATCPADFSGDGFVGKYCVDGQTFRANIGKFQTTNIGIALKAQLHHIDTVDGMKTSGTSSVHGGVKWVLKNTANFSYRDSGNGYNGSSELFPTVLPDKSEEGINDKEAFLKNAPRSISVDQGTQAVIPFTLRVDTARTGILLANSKIVDYVDHSVFSIGDSSNNFDGVTISGNYGSEGLDKDDFELSTDAAGDLVLVLSAAGLAKTGLVGEGDVMDLTVGLRTHVLDGKQTVDVVNNARLFGSSTDNEFWSETTGRATSFGNEAEARKFLYDATTDGLVPVLPVQVDEDGNVPAGSDVFVYQLMYIGHGNYTRTSLKELVDTLPAGMEFLGFLNSDQLGDPEGNANPGPTVDAGGNINATFTPSTDPANSGTVSLALRSNESFTFAESAQVYFAVRVSSLVGDLVNGFETQKAIIHGYKEPSIDIEKWTDEGEAPEYDAAGKLLNDGYKGDFDATPGKQLKAGKDQPIRFTISNDGGEPLVDIAVSDELTSGKGKIKDLVCTFPDDSTGTSWDGPLDMGAQFECTGTLPALAAGDRHADTAKVTAIGQISGTAVNDEDDWHGNVPAAPLVNTGGQALTGLAVLGGVGILAGVLLMLLRRRNAAA